MAITVADDAVLLLDGIERIKFFRDADYAPAPPLTAFFGDVQTLLRCTDDGRLKVDASVTIDNVDLGDVDLKAKDESNISRYLQVQTDEHVNRYALIVNDPVMERTLRGFTPIQMSLTRDANGNISTITETDGILTKTTTITRDANDDVLSIAEAVV